MLYDAEEQFIKTGLQLPPAPAPKGVYKPCLISGNYIYLSGHLPVITDGTTIKGRVGSELNEDQGKQAAQQAALTMLASIKGTLGSLNRVKRVVKVFGMVNCTPDFVRQPYVINGCSELFAAIWGEDAGVGTRSATGVASLPDNVPVEIEGIFEI
jgi:enamine deaminase RidA (YjgF/YER057c/UK114 family)